MQPYSQRKVEKTVSSAHFKGGGERQPQTRPDLQVATTACILQLICADKQFLLPLRSFRDRSQINNTSTTHKQSIVQSIACLVCPAPKKINTLTYCITHFSPWLTSQLKTLSFDCNFNEKKWRRNNRSEHINNTTTTLEVKQSNSIITPNSLTSCFLA